MLAAGQHHLTLPRRQNPGTKKGASFPTRRLQTPPLQGVFYEGQLWDACSLVEGLKRLLSASLKANFCPSSENHIGMR